jgi:hypothetical protein
MVPTLFFYQPLLIALLWLCLMRKPRQHRLCWLTRLGIGHALVC